MLLPECISVIGSITLEQGETLEHIQGLEQLVIGYHQRILLTLPFIRGLLGLAEIAGSDRSSPPRYGLE